MKHELRIGGRLGLGRRDAGTEQAFGFAAGRLDDLVGQDAEPSQEGLVLAEAFPRALLLDPLEVDVGARVVGGRVWSRAVVNGLDSVGPPPARARSTATRAAS